MLSPWNLNDDIADSVNHNNRGKLCLWHSQNSSGDVPELLVDPSKAVVKDNHWPYTSMSSGNLIVHIRVCFFRLNISLPKVNHKEMYDVCLAGLFSVEGQQCVSNPCHFNGTCTDIGSSNYSCQCPLGFTGKKSHWCFSWYIIVA